MRDELLYFYERELTFLRRTGAEFAKRYPKVASRLLLEPTKCDDPHVERLLEGFAFLAARVHLKIEDDFPEISEALLNVVYPNYTRPIPSMSLVEFQLDPEQGKLTTGYSIPRGSMLYSRPVAGEACKFRTCYDTTLWPVKLVSARFTPPHNLSPPVRGTDVFAALELELECAPDVDFGQLEIDHLRLHLRAESNLASMLYEVLCNNCREVLLRDARPGGRPEPISLPGSAIAPVGFGEDEGMLPWVRRSFVGYRVLQEYFTFPDKFYFLDLTGLDVLRTAKYGPRLKVVCLLSQFALPDRRAVMEAGVNTDTIRLGATPIVNLFPQTSEPVLLTQRRHDYLIVPDARRRETTGIFSVDEVVAVTPGQSEALHFEPLYSYRHTLDDGEARQFWYATRRPREWRMDEDTDVYLTFADLSGRVLRPDADAVTARLTCYNGELPSRLPFSDPAGDFELAGGGPIEKIVTLTKPTAALQPPLGRPQLWRLISQLSLNYGSLLDAGVDGLRELLRLHDFAGTPSTEKQIRGITSVTGRPCYSRIESEFGLTFARGHRVEIEFDEEEYAGGGMYLLASVLERFLGLYVSLNSFCILAARSKQRKELVREWAPRAGWKALL